MRMDLTCGFLPGFTPGGRSRGAWVCSVASSKDWGPLWDTSTISDRRARVKQELRDKIQIARKEQRVVKNAPATNVNLREDLEQDIVSTIKKLESMAPYPKPLIQNPSLIDGIWRTLYSDAREISFLAKLPGGFRCGQVLQVVDLENAKFFNIAVIHHRTWLLKGFVRVSAIFTPAPSRSMLKKRGVFQLDGNLILIQFKLRSYHLSRLAILPNIFKKQPIRVGDHGLAALKDVTDDTTSS
mmetsp:Transcript_45075/g.174901  ORF Transcript_45075/g.174901 Transcript_45075/m.174901 type:complete len:241 (-) Transcript_45075:2746-3468(-)